MPLEIQIHHHLDLPNPHLLNTPGSKATFPLKKCMDSFPLYFVCPRFSFLLQFLQNGTECATSLVSKSNAGSF